MDGMCLPHIFLQPESRTEIKRWWGKNQLKEIDEVAKQKGKERIEILAELTLSEYPCLREPFSACRISVVGKTFVKTDHVGDCKYIRDDRK